MYKAPINTLQCFLSASLLNKMQRLLISIQQKITDSSLNYLVGNLILGVTKKVLGY